MKTLRYLATSLYYIAPPKLVELGSPKPDHDYTFQVSIDNLQKLYGFFLLYILIFI